MRFPGEEDRLAMRMGGHPITDEEAVGVQRRMIRTGGKKGPLPTEIPYRLDGARPILAVRIDEAVQWKARARAEMEGTTLARIVDQFLSAYAASSPGSALAMVTSGVEIRPVGEGERDE